MPNSMKIHYLSLLFTYQMEYKINITDRCSGGIEEPSTKIIFKTNTYIKKCRHVVYV